MFADSKCTFMFHQAVFESRLGEQSVAVPLMCCAAHMLCVPSRKQVVIVGNKSAKEFQDMVAEVHSSYDPNKTVSCSSPLPTVNQAYVTNRPLYCDCECGFFFFFPIRKKTCCFPSPSSLMCLAKCLGCGNHGFNYFLFSTISRRACDFFGGRYCY